MSSSPCVGCAWRPSPALTTCTCGAHVLRDQVRRAATASGARRTCRRASPTGWRWCRAGLALGGRRARDVEVDHVGRQPLGGDLERRARARRVLEEQVEDALAAQQRHLLHLALVDAEERCRRCRGCACRIARGRPSIDSRWISSPLRLSCGLRRTNMAARSTVTRISKLKRPSSSRAERRSRCAARGSVDRAGRAGGARSAARGRRGRPAPPARRSPAGRSRTAR